LVEFAVVTGQSGAGRSQAANFLEDLGWFVIDNLPSALIPKVSELAGDTGSRFDRMALVAGGGEDASAISAALRQLRRPARRPSFVATNRPSGRTRGMDRSRWSRPSRPNDPRSTRFGPRPTW